MDIDLFARWPSIVKRANVPAPARAKDYPDRDRLSLRFERFKAAA